MQINITMNIDDSKTDKLLEMLFGTPESKTRKLNMKNLKQERKKIGLNAKLLAKVSDISPATISLIENGLHTPSKKTAKKISEAFSKIRKTNIFKKEMAS